MSYLIAPALSSFTRKSSWLLPVAICLGGCSDNQSASSKLSHTISASSEQDRRNFMLREAYSNNYCFLHKYYWKDSLANVQDICKAQGQVYDSINQVQIEVHGWQSGYCHINTFLLISQGEKKWFVPFCDELQLGSSRGRKDTAFFKNDLIITQPLNAAVSGLALPNRPLFIRSLLNLLFASRREKRIIAGDSLPQSDNRTANYIRRKVGRPNIYFYYSLQGVNAIWEFTDLGPRGVQIRVIRPGRYICFDL